MNEKEARIFINTHIIINGNLNKNFNRPKTFVELKHFLEPMIGKNIVEKLYLFYYRKSIPKCECGKDLPFIIFSHPYNQFCSNKCGRESLKTKKKYKQTCLKKYGVDNSNKSAIISDKKSKTMLNKSKQQKNEISQKRKKTYLNKYGVDHPSKNKTILNKIINTNKSKSKTEKNEIQEKRKLTTLQKYGVDHISKIKEIQSKIINNRKETIKKNMIEKYYNLPHVIPLFTLSDYNGIHYSNKYKWKCKKCNNEFEDDVYANRMPRCPYCFPKKELTSFFEIEIKNYLQNLNIFCELNNRSIIAPKELDIYIPNHHLAIEFDGLYWHSESLRDKNYHLNKTNLCLEKGIQLIHIFEDEWIEKQETVKSIIKSKLELFDQIIYGRKCVVKEINSKQANKFYEVNHIQGQVSSRINLGLFHCNELVSCLSFAKPRFNKKYDWEITRFANKLNTKIIGSFAKLFKHKPEGSIITYSDKRLFTGEIYKNNGFKQLKDSSPSYYYINHGKRYSRIQFQKHKLNKLLESFDSNLTEWENMQLNGWDRIWDCGNYVFEYII